MITKNQAAELIDLLNEFAKAQAEVTKECRTPTGNMQMIRDNHLGVGDKATAMIDELFTKKKQHRRVVQLMAGFMVDFDTIMEENPGEWDDVNMVNNNLDACREELDNYLARLVSVDGGPAYDMTIRDEFAKEIAAAIVSIPGLAIDKTPPLTLPDHAARVAGLAYSVADAMIEERAK